MWGVFVGFCYNVHAVFASKWSVLIFIKERYSMAVTVMQEEQTDFLPARHRIFLWRFYVVYLNLTGISRG